MWAAGDCVVTHHRLLATTYVPLGTTAHKPVNVFSAGTDPDEQVDAVALSSLAELGIDGSDQVPTQLTGDLLNRADVAVTLRPVLDLPHRPGVCYENWPLPDPQGGDLAGIQPLRGHLKNRVTHLLAQLEGQGPGRTGSPTAPDPQNPADTQPRHTPEEETAP